MISFDAPLAVSQKQRTNTKNVPVATKETRTSYCCTYEKYLREYLPPFACVCLVWAITDRCFAFYIPASSKIKVALLTLLQQNRGALSARPPIPCKQPAPPHYAQSSTTVATTYSLTIPTLAVCEREQRPENVSHLHTDHLHSRCGISNSRGRQTPEICTVCCISRPRAGSITKNKLHALRRIFSWNACETKQVLENISKRWIIKI